MSKCYAVRAYRDEVTTFPGKWASQFVLIKKGAEREERDTLQMVKTEEEVADFCREAGLRKITRQLHRGRNEIVAVLLPRFEDTLFGA